MSLCALLVLLLCAESLVGVTEGWRRGVRSRGNSTSSGCPRGLSGGTTWTACAGSSLLAIAAMLL